VSDAVSGPIKVLVIDDSNTIRRSAEIFLRQAGFEHVLGVERECARADRAFADQVAQFSVDTIAARLSRVSLTAIRLGFDPAIWCQLPFPRPAK